MPVEQRAEDPLRAEDLPRVLPRDRSRVLPAEDLPRVLPAEHRLRVWLAPSQFLPHVGGVEEMTLRLAQYLAGAGHDVLVLANRWPRDLPERETIEGVRVVRLPYEIPARRPRTLALYATSRRRCARILARLPRPDVIGVQCISSQLPALSAYARANRVPLVLSTHGEVIADHDRIYQTNWYLPRALRRLGPRATELTACSEWIREQTVQEFPDFARASVIPNGVDPGEWAVGPLPTAPRVGAWGRLVPQKGFDLLLDAFELVRRDVPGAVLQIGGDGPELARLQELAGEGVTFAGPLDRDGVRELLGRSRIMVVPSRVEAFGIVALEALAAGRGLVWAKGTGLAEAAGPCGRPADALDPLALAAAIVAELAEPTPAAAAAAWVETCTWDAVGARYAAVLRAAAPAAAQPSLARA